MINYTKVKCYECGCGLKRALVSKQYICHNCKLRKNNDRTKKSKIKQDGLL